MLSSVYSPPIEEDVSSAHSWAVTRENKEKSKVLFCFLNIYLGHVGSQLWHTSLHHVGYFAAMHRLANCGVRAQ